MLALLTAQQMRAYDRRATEALGVPGLELMENAGLGATERALELLGQSASPSAAQSATLAPHVVVVAGAGNNGGDGFVVARRLAAAGVSVETFLAAPADKLRGDALQTYQVLVDAGGVITQLESDSAPLATALEKAGLVVDALFGTGLDREITGFLARVVEAINAAPCRKLALDLPSGLHADTGRILGVCVRADFTVTFAHRKLGLCTPRGAELAGIVNVAPIVSPDEPQATGIAAELLEARDVAAWLPRRNSSAHKSSAGRVLVVAGSPGKLGAALLSALGAQRAGAGLVTIASMPACADALDQRVLEAMTARIDPANVEASIERLAAPCDAVVVGPGLGLDAEARRVVEAVARSFPGPKVLDADAISHFAGRAGELSKLKNVVLTPHSGELGRLLGVPYSEIDDDRYGAVERAVAATSAVVLLKGRFSIVGAPGGLPCVNPTGGPVLATGGTGDVLSGIIASLCCELPPRDAAVAGAYLHGAAADAWATAHAADRGLLAHEVADAVPEALGRLRTS